MSLQPVVRIGDPGSHGGAMTSGARTVTVDGLAICRVGDTYACPQHGDNPITQGSAFFAIEGQPVARINEDQTVCGAVITAGSPTLAAT